MSNCYWYFITNVVIRLADKLKLSSWKMKWMWFFDEFWVWFWLCGLGPHKEIKKTCQIALGISSQLIAMTLHSLECCKSIIRLSWSKSSWRKVKWMWSFDEFLVWFWLCDLWSTENFKKQVKLQTRYFITTHG